MVPSILITGGTGFVGGAVLAHLLNEHPKVTIVALARGSVHGSPRTRLLASVRRFLPGAAEATFDRLQVVSGALADENSLLALPWQNVTHVVHLAVDSTASGRASLSNVAGTLTLATLAARSRHFTRFLYVGSAWSWGPASSQDVAVHEDDYCKAGSAPIPARAAYLVDKVRAEYQLERLVDLPLTVAIPSLAAGHSRLGCGPSASLFWVFRLLDRAACIPWRRSHRVDVVPVDWLAAALVQLLLRPTLPHRRYHLSAGAGGCVTWEQLEGAFALASGAARDYRYARELTPAVAWPAGADTLTPQRRWTLLTHCLQFLSNDAIFDNGRALQLGIPAPAKLTSYLEVCLRSARDRTIEAQALDDV